MFRGEEMRKIYTFRGEVILVSNQDYKKVSKWKWWVKNGYAIREFYDNAKHRTIKMHRFILGLMSEVDRDIWVDHINRNRLDNRRSNLRRVTKVQSAYNRGKNRNSRSKYRGVTQVQNSENGKIVMYKTWSANIYFNDKHYYLGTHKTQEEAALAYNNAAKKFFGKYATLNAIL